MKIHTTLFRSAIPLLTTLVAVPAVWAGIEPDPFHFGQVGLARLQVAHLNIYVPPPNDDQPPSDDTNVCHVSLSFVDGAGNAVVNAAGVAIAAEYDLSPGESAALELTAADAFKDRSRRVDIRPIVTFVSPTDDQQLPVDPCLGAVPTLELYDALTGRTQIVLYPFIPSVNDASGQPPDDNSPSPTGQ